MELSYFLIHKINNRPWATQTRYGHSSAETAHTYLKKDYINWNLAMTGK